jgi:GNAT superfamily N-acetyltransferase
MRTTSHICRARRSDRDELRAVQEAAMRQLGAVCYEPEVIEAFIAQVGTMDDRLIEDGTYFVMLARGMIVGCGGWSVRKPGDAAHVAADSAPDSHPVATIRGVYVRPAWARQGIAQRIVAAVEADIMANGYHRAALSATLTSIPFCRHLGYRGGEPVVLQLQDGLRFVSLAMTKKLAQYQGLRLENAA